jgi:hypothetical protein
LDWFGDVGYTPVFWCKSADDADGKEVESFWRCERVGKWNRAKEFVEEEERAGSGTGEGRAGIWEVTTQGSRDCILCQY